MFNPVNSTCKHIELEHRILDWWRDTQAFEKLRQKNTDTEPCR